LKRLWSHLDSRVERSLPDGVDEPLDLCRLRFGDAGQSLVDQHPKGRAGEQCRIARRQCVDGESSGNPDNRDTVLRDAQEQGVEFVAPDRITEAITRDEPRPARVVPPRADEEAHITLGRRHELDALFLSIARDRVPVVRVAGRFTIDALSPSDAALLASPSFRVLIDKRLTGIAKSQAAEIKRLVDAIRKRAFDPTIEVGPQALQTLWQHWQEHPDVQRALPKAEGGRTPSLVDSTPKQNGIAPVAERKPVGGLAAQAAIAVPVSDQLVTRAKGPGNTAAPVVPRTKGPER
jgi:hypothetical protein